jgi:hypothetical protein
MSDAYGLTLHSSVRDFRDARGAGDYLISNVICTYRRHTCQKRTIRGTEYAILFLTVVEQLQENKLVPFSNPPHLLRSLYRCARAHKKQSRQNEAVKPDQHHDGHHHLFSMSVPTNRSTDSVAQVERESSNSNSNNPDSYSQRSKRPRDDHDDAGDSIVVQLPNNSSSNHHQQQHGLSVSDLFPFTTFGLKRPRNADSSSSSFVQAFSENRYRATVVSFKDGMCLPEDDDGSSSENNNSYKPPTVSDDGSSKKNAASMVSRYGESDSVQIYLPKTDISDALANIRDFEVNLLDEGASTSVFDSEDSSDCTGLDEEIEYLESVVSSLKKRTTVATTNPAALPWSCAANNKPPKLVQHMAMARQVSERETAAGIRFNGSDSDRALLFPQAPGVTLLRPAFLETVLESVERYDQSGGSGVYNHHNHRHGPSLMFDHATIQHQPQYHQRQQQQQASSLLLPAQVAGTASLSGLHDLVVPPAQQHFDSERVANDFMDLFGAVQGFLGDIGNAMQ